MALRSVLEIDVDDAQFRRFLDLFQRYQGAVARLPSQWRGANQATAATKGDIADMSAMLMAQQEMLQRSSRAAEGLGRAMGPVERSARNIASYIAETTRNLIRWSSITAIAGGLLGAGGLFGLERLAASAGGMRRGALGLGTTSGEQQAFEINLNRVLNARGFLSNVNEALNDVTKRWTLGAAGLSPSQYMGQNSVQVAQQLLPAIKRIVDSAPAGQLAQILQARGLSHLISLDEAVRLRNTPYSELESFITRSRRDVTGMAISDADLKRWQDFHVQLERVGNTMYNSLVRGLTPLAPALEKLSVAAAKAIEAFFKSDFVREGLEKVAGGLDWLAKKVDTPEFRQGIEDFVKGIVEIGKAIVAVLRWLGRRGVGAGEGLGIVPHDSASVGDDAAWKRRGDDFAKWVESQGGPKVGSGQDALRNWTNDPANAPAVQRWLYRNPISKYLGGGSSGGVVPRGRGLNYGQLKQLALEAGFPAGDAAIMAAISMAESSGDPYAHNTRYPDDSYGITQINRYAHPDAAKAYGNPAWAMWKAYELYQGRIARGQGRFSDWSVFKNGAYRAHMNGALVAPPEGIPEWAGPMRKKTAVPAGEKSPASPADTGAERSDRSVGPVTLRIYNQTGGSAIVGAAQVA